MDTTKRTMQLRGKVDRITDVRLPRLAIPHERKNVIHGRLIPRYLVYRSRSASQVLSRSMQVDHDVLLQIGGRFSWALHGLLHSLPAPSWAIAACACLMCVNVEAVVHGFGP